MDQRVAVEAGVVVVVRGRRLTQLVVAMVDGVQPHRFCEREGVPANAVPLLRDDWRLRAAVEVPDGAE